MADISPNNYQVGQGRLFFSEKKSDGTYAGELYLGDTPGFSIALTAEQVQVYSTYPGIQEQVVTRPRRLDRAATIRVKNISVENLALFVMADESASTQTTTPVADEARGSVKQGRWYQLGVSATNPTGVRNVSSVTVTTKADAACVLNTDYKLDAALGRIYIIPGSTVITDGTELKVDYTPAASVRTLLKAAQDRIPEGRLRFIAENISGDEYDLYAPHVVLTPNGELGFIDAENTAEMEFQAQFLPDGDTPSVILEKRPS